ncbi:MAG: hypothetical protein V2B15_06520 [Bacteroidota bacterium]
MKKNIWLFIAILFIGFSAGLMTGVAIDKDKVYNTTIKKIRQNRGEGDIVIDVETPSALSDKEMRQADREKRREERQKKKNQEP